MTLTRFAVRVSLFWHQQQLITRQARLIRTLKRQQAAQQLNHARDIQGLASAWLLSIEMPELDIRDELADLERAMGEQAAILEEHIL